MDNRFHQELESEERIANELHRILQAGSILLDSLDTTETDVPSNPLQVAVHNGDAKLTKQILSRNPELAKELDQHGSTALHTAAAAGDHEVVKELLKKVGSTLGLVQDRCGMMPIHTAALNGRTKALRELFDACPDSRRKATCHLDTIMHLAVRSNSFEAVQFLVERLEDDAELLNAKNAKGNTILHLAVGRKRAEIVKLLLSTRRIDVNAMNLKSFTPLDVLLESPTELGDMALASMLLAAGGKRAPEPVHLPGTATIDNNINLAAKTQDDVFSVSNCSKRSCNSLMQLAGITSETDEFMFFLLASSSLCTAMVLATNAMLQLFPNSHLMLFNYHASWVWFSRMTAAWIGLLLTARLFGRLPKKLGDRRRRPEDAVERKPEQQKAMKLIVAVVAAAVLCYCGQHQSFLQFPTRII